MLIEFTESSSRFIPLSFPSSLAAAAAEARSKAALEVSEALELKPILTNGHSQRPENGGFLYSPDAYKTNEPSVSNLHQAMAAALEQQSSQIPLLPPLYDEASGSASASVRA